MGNANWETPKWFFNTVELALGPFTFDAAADKSNAKCHSFLDAEFDSLTNDWPFEFQNTWLNPPFTDVGGWIDRCWTEARLRGNKTVALLPIPRGDRWMVRLRDYAEIWEVDGRIRFIDPETRERTSPVGGNILAIFHRPVNGVYRPAGYSGGRIDILDIPADHWSS